jgi:DNA primase
MDYLVSRKVSLESIHKFMIGYFDVNEYSKFYDRMVFPVFNPYGQCMSLQGRAMFDWVMASEELGSKIPKYYHGEFDKNALIYGLHENGQAIVQSNVAVITEGPFDVIACYQSRIPALALLGTSFQNNQAALLRRYCNNAIIWLDSDKAGIRATENLSNTLDRAGFRVYTVEGSEHDPSDTYQNYGQAKIKEYINAARAI